MQMIVDQASFCENTVSVKTLSRMNLRLHTSTNGSTALTPPIFHRWQLACQSLLSPNSLVGVLLQRPSAFPAVFLA